MKPHICSFQSGQRRQPLPPFEHMPGFTYKRFRITERCPYGTDCATMRITDYSWRADGDLFPVRQLTIQTLGNVEFRRWRATEPFSTTERYTNSPDPILNFIGSNRVVEATRDGELVECTQQEYATIWETID